MKKSVKHRKSSAKAPKRHKTSTSKHKSTSKPKPSKKTHKPASKAAKKGKMITFAVQKNKKIGGEAKHKYEQEFVRSHIAGFDALLKDGIPKGSSVLVQGGPGSGKTILCLTLLKNFCERGKKVLYMSFEEPEEKLKYHMHGFGIDVDKYDKKGLLYIKRFNALDIARSVEALLSEAKKELLIDVQPVLIPKDFQPDIVLIDSLTSISSAFSGEDSRFRIYMEQLFRYLEGHDMTSFLIREVASPTNIGNHYSEKGEAVSFLSDGIIAVYNVFFPKKGFRKRAIEILKMRGTPIDRKIVECDIVKGKGFVVKGTTVSGDYILT